MAKKPTKEDLKKIGVTLDAADYSGELYYVRYAMLDDKLWWLLSDIQKVITSSKILDVVRKGHTEHSKNHDRPRKNWICEETGVECKAWVVTSEAVWGIGEYYEGRNILGWAKFLYKLANEDRLYKQRKLAAKVEAVPEEPVQVELNFGDTAQQEAPSDAAKKGAGFVSGTPCEGTEGDKGEDGPKGSIVPFHYLSDDPKAAQKELGELGELGESKDGWMTMKEAQEKGLARRTIYDRINKGIIPSKLKDGTRYVWIAPDTLSLIDKLTGDGADVKTFTDAQSADVSPVRPVTQNTPAIHPSVNALLQDVCSVLQEEAERNREFVMGIIERLTSAPVKPYYPPESMKRVTVNKPAGENLNGRQYAPGAIHQDNIPINHARVMDRREIAKHVPAATTAEWGGNDQTRPGEVSASHVANHYRWYSDTGRAHTAAVIAAAYHMGFFNRGLAREVPVNNPNSENHPAKLVLFGKEGFDAFGVECDRTHIGQKVFSVPYRNHSQNYKVMRNQVIKAS